MKKLLFFTLLLIGTMIVNSQQLYFESGKTISSFDYKNSQGETLDNLQSTNYTFVNIGYRRSIFTKNLYLDIGGIYNSYGSKGSDRELDNYYDWDLSYLGLSLGLDYEFLKSNSFSFCIKAFATAEFLIQGTQTLNNQVYQLSEEEDFNTAIYFLRAGLGISYEISKNLSIYTDYTFGKGATFKDIQGDLKIDTHQFGIGLLVNISKNKPSIKDDLDAQIEELKKEQHLNSKKIKELEVNAQQANLLKQENLAKEREIQLLKESISQALFNYEGKGLTIEEREGKIYVTMENDILFKAGSWKIDDNGEKTVNALGTAIANNPDIEVLIEGHTDNEPYKGNGNIINNWDLSTKRATSIVEILTKNENINPKNIIAAGKGEFDPIADNSTEEGQAKNRRIEVILTPKIDEILKLIKN